jgi:hypothetical protein
MGSMLQRERERLDAIFLNRASRYSELEEKLYCRILVTASYLSNNLAVMTVFRWIHYQGIQVKIEPLRRRKTEPFLRFIEEALESHKIVSHNLDPFGILTYINSLIFNEILSRGIQKKDDLELKSFRVVYRFLARGILRSSAWSNT